MPRIPNACVYMANYNFCLFAQEFAVERHGNAAKKKLISQKKFKRWKQQKKGVNPFYKV